MNLAVSFKEDLSRHMQFDFECYFKMKHLRIDLWKHLGYNAHVHYSLLFLHPA